MIPDDFKDRVRENTDLVGLIQRDGVALKKVGGVEWRGLCPFHKETTPSFTVNESKGFFHCFGCAAHGDCYDWVMSHRAIDFMEALKLLAHAAGLTVPGGSASFEKKIYRPAVQPQQGATLAPVIRKRGLAADKFRPLQPGSDAWRYLTEKRKIGETVLGEYRLCETHSKEAFYQDREDWQAVGFVYADPAQPQRDGKARIEFIKCLNLAREQSVREDGAVKWLKTEWRNPDSRRSILFGMDAVPLTVRHLVICEGEMDALSWRTFGHWAVSVPNGAKSQGWIDLCTPWLERFDRIYLSFDEDSAGRGAVTELAVRMGIERASIVRMPENNKLCDGLGGHSQQRMVSTIGDDSTKTK